MVTYVGLGVVASGTTTTSPGLPTGLAVGDLMVCVISCNNSSSSSAPTMTAGWTKRIDKSGSFGSTQGGGARWSSIFYKVYAAGDTTPTVSYGGSSSSTAVIIASISAFRLGTSTNIWAIGGYQIGSSDSNALSLNSTNATVASGSGISSNEPGVYVGVGTAALSTITAGLTATSPDVVFSPAFAEIVDTSSANGYGVHHVHGYGLYTGGESSPSKFTITQSNSTSTTGNVVGAAFYESPPIIVKSGTGSFTVSAPTIGGTGSKSYGSTGAFTGSATLTGTVKKSVGRTGAISNGSTVTSTGKKGALSTNGFSGSAVVTATGQKAGKGTGSFTVTLPTFSSSGKKSVGRTSLINLSSSVSSTGFKNGQSTSTIILNPVVTSVGLKSGESDDGIGTGYIPLTCTLSASGSKTTQGVGTFVAVASVTSTGQKNVSRTGVISINSLTVTSTGNKTTENDDGIGFGWINATAVLMGVGAKNYKGTGLISHTGFSLVAIGGKASKGTGIIPTPVFTFSSQGKGLGISKGTGLIVPTSALLRAVGSKKVSGTGIIPVAYLVHGSGYTPHMKLKTWNGVAETPGFYITRFEGFGNEERFVEFQYIKT